VNPVGTLVPLQVYGKLLSAMLHCSRHVVWLNLFPLINVFLVLMLPISNLLALLPINPAKMNQEVVTINEIRTRPRYQEGQIEALACHLLVQFNTCRKWQWGTGLPLSKLSHSPLGKVVLHCKEANEGAPGQPVVLVTCAHRIQLQLMNCLTVIRLPQHLQIEGT
jgi:hypothetical protein